MGFYIFPPQDMFGAQMPEFPDVLLQPEVATLNIWVYNKYLFLEGKVICFLGNSFHPLSLVQEGSKFPKSTRDSGNRNSIFQNSFWKLMDLKN